MEEIKKALDEVNAWFDSINYDEETANKPFKFKDGEEVMYKSGETIQKVLQYAVDNNIEV